MATELTAKAARIAGDEARTRIVIDFDQKPDFSVHYLENPDRIVVDIEADTRFAFPPETLSARGIYSIIRFGAMSAGKTRIVLTSKHPAGLEIAEAQADESGNGWRLVLDGATITPEKHAELMHAAAWAPGAPQAAAAALPPQAGKDTFLVAVDAGHGGIDTGAASEAKPTVLEKNITLDFARSLTERLNGLPGIKAFMTRSDDTFLSLSERVQIARTHGASLFISLHADKLGERDTRGSTVYTISDKASDKLAEQLARRENKSDEIAGEDKAQAPSEVNDILIDLTRRETQAFSINLADSIVKSFEGQVGLINNPHRYAGFMVLKAPDVPSVLIELGFLSNKEDVKLLTDTQFRDKVVGLIGGAVEAYRAKVGG